MSIDRFTPRRVLGSAVTRAVAYAEASHQVSCRNALWSSLAMVEARRQRDEIDAFLDAHARHFHDRRAVAGQQSPTRRKVPVPPRPAPQGVPIS